MRILDSAYGHYGPVGDPAKADLIIGHSFGTSIEKGSPNHELAEFILDHANGRPIVADRTLVNAFPNKDADVTVVVEGPISNAIGTTGGTLGVLVAAKNFMVQEGLITPMQVGQRNHIGRVAWQGTEKGLDMNNAILPKGLTGKWDRNSDQLWTRSLEFWLPREITGFGVLQAQRWMRSRGKSVPLALEGLVDK